MTEPTSQAAPQDPVTPASAEAPEFAPSQGSTQQEPPKDQPLTPEQIAAIEKIADQRAFRVAQSQVAKGESRIQKQIQERFAALEQTKAALNLTDQQVAQARQNIVAEAYSSPEETPTTPQGAGNQPQTQAAPGADEAIKVMNAGINQVFSEVGQTVTRSDPEFQDLQKAIDAAWNDENGYPKIILAANRAATAKAARLQRQSQTAAGRVTGGGSQTSGQASRPQSAHGAWGEAYQKQ